MCLNGRSRANNQFGPQNTLFEGPGVSKDQTIVAKKIVKLEFD